MRIGLVCPYSLDVAGGVQQQVLDLADALRRRGHEARVLAPGTPRDGLPQHVTTTGGQVPLRWNGAVARVHMGTRAGRITRTWLADGAFDVLHVHEPVTPSVTWHAVRETLVPVVATAHTAQERGHVLRWGAATASRRVCDNVSVWTAVSDDAAATLARYCEAAPVLVPNALQVDAFDVPGVHRGEGPTRVLFLGRLEEPRKGLTVALQAFAAVATSRPDVVLDVAGPGDLETVARRLRPALPPDVRRRVRVVGPVDLSAKAALLSRADVMVAPQLGGESFGIVVAEAMAAGAAVVASDLPAFTRLLRDGECGVLVPRGDVPAWAGALGDLLDDPDRRAALGKRARDAVQHLDWRRVTSSLLDVYAEALDPGR
jgi:phosphatidyl-myo-inositol alpha-mannosyltransferase